MIGTFLLGVLGTQFPFEYRLSSFALQRHWQRVDWSWFPHIHGGFHGIDLEDLVVNLVMLVPLGAGWALWRRARPGRVLVESIVVGSLVGTFYEGAQLLTRDRHTTLADVWRNTLSCVLGCAVVLALGALLDRRRGRLLPPDP